jgi:hypothetical protein
MCLNQKKNTEILLSIHQIPIPVEHVETGLVLVPFFSLPRFVQLQSSMIRPSDPRMRLATELFLGDESFENDEEFAIWLYMVIYG